MRTVLAGGLAMLVLSAMTATAFASEKKPTAETKAATGVEISVATLNGVVNPEGEATEYRFEYGTTSVEEHKTEWVSAGSGTANVPVSAKLTALKVDTKYEFRLKAESNGNGAKGATLNFTTKGSTAPPEFKATGQGFTSTIGTSKWTVYGGTITCSKGTDSGEVTGKYTLGKVATTFTGCESSGRNKSGCPVGSPGRSGEVVMDALQGELGTVKTSEAASGVGILLKPETGSRLVGYEENACTPESFMTGSMAGEVVTVGKSQKTNELVFGVTKESPTIKEIALSSGEIVKPYLGDGFFEESVMATSDALTFTEATEVT